MFGIISSIVLFGEGLLTGLTLTAMVGPVTMVILRYGMQVNKIAGVWAAIGTWISDLVFIAGTFWMTESLKNLTETPSVQKWIYFVGGAGLTIIGIMLMRARRTPIAPEDINTVTSYTQAFASGFLVNSLSPFTLFFWIGAALFLHLQDDNPLWYYVGLMLTLALGDFLKAWLAPELTKWINEKYVYWIQVGAGIVIAMTGIYIIIRGFV